jgi:hypothetical protein
MTVNGIIYTAGYRERKRSRKVVTYVHTEDPSFISPDGLRIGDVVTVKSAENVFEMLGWEIYSGPGSGWIPVIGFCGEVNVVHDGQPDERKKLKTLLAGRKTAVRLRIEGFTKRTP